MQQKNAAVFLQFLLSPSFLLFLIFLCFPLFFLYFFLLFLMFPFLPSLPPFPFFPFEELFSAQENWQWPNLNWFFLGRLPYYPLTLSNYHLSLTNFTNRYTGFSLEHPQGVGIVGIVGTVGIVGIVGIEFYRPEPRPSTPSVLVDTWRYSYLKEEKNKVYTIIFPIIYD